MTTEINTHVLVLGGGPGGYSAAFRCSDLGMQTVLVENYKNLGGVCLNKGCIPSKSLLNFSKNIQDFNVLNNIGILNTQYNIDINNLKVWKENIIEKFALSLKKEAERKKINIIYGLGVLIGLNKIKVHLNNNSAFLIINFQELIISTGSLPKKLSCISSRYKSDKRIWNSTDALSIPFIPKKLLIIGGGVIGIEMATVYHTLGSEICIVESSNQILSEVDSDMINIFIKKVLSDYDVFLNMKIVFIELKDEGVYVSIKGSNNLEKTILCDAVLVSVGRVPNINMLNLEKIGILLNSDGFIQVDCNMKTNIPHIYAIGDVVGLPMLAHKSYHQGRLVAEVISGRNYKFSPKIIPCVSYTVPEIAWVGYTEKNLKKVNNIEYKVSYFPWSSSGRAVVMNCQYGMTKLIFENKTNRILGGAILGVNASELLGEICLAIEMDCEADDLALTIHPHPTLNESIGLASEIYSDNMSNILDF